MENDKKRKGPEKIKLSIKPYTTLDLARIYEVDKKTFVKWVAELRQELGERKGHYYSTSQVKLIFSELMLPSHYELIE